MDNILCNVIIIGIVSSIYILYRKLKFTYSYWERKSIKGPKPIWFLGNFDRILRKLDSVHSLTEKFTESYPNEKFVGIYQGLSPTLIISDPELIKQVLIKDFAYFTDRGVQVTTNDPFSEILFFQRGNDWRLLRQRLSPLFTSVKLKQMMPILNTCVKEYINYVDKLIKDDNSQEMRNLNMKFTLKTITSIAFGLEIDIFTDNKSVFEQMANRIFESSNKKIFKNTFRICFPKVADFLRLKVTNEGVREFFTDLVQKIVKDREGKPKERKDFMDCMIELKEQGTVVKNNNSEVHEIEITDKLMVAEALEFYAAGFITTSGTLAYLLYELALNPKIQDRCYNDVKVVMDKTNGEISFNDILDLHYIGMVFDETLRKYPIAGVLFRESTNEYKFSGLMIEKGIKILIPVTALHKNPKYFPNPELFDPERFSPEKKATILDCTYLPFGDGPRNCIGKFI